MFVGGRYPLFEHNRNIRGSDSGQFCYWNFHSYYLLILLVCSLHTGQIDSSVYSDQLERMYFLLGGAQLKSYGGPKQKFWHIQGPKLFCLTHSTGVFIKERSKIWGFAGQIKSFCWPHLARGPYVLQREINIHPFISLNSSRYSRLSSIVIFECIYYIKVFILTSDEMSLVIWGLVPRTNKI